MCKRQADPGLFCSFFFFFKFLVIVMTFLARLWIHGYLSRDFTLLFIIIYYKIGTYLIYSFVRCTWLFQVYALTEVAQKG